MAEERQPGSYKPTVHSSTADTAGVDFDLLDHIRGRLCSDERFQNAAYRPDFAPNSVVFYYHLGYYPSTIEEAKLRVKWHENGDFNIHYQEDFENGDNFSHRWDRHPNSHNTRDHIHPGPDAPRNGDDANHPEDWRDVLSEVLREIDERIKQFWD